MKKVVRKLAQRWDCRWLCWLIASWLTHVIVCIKAGSWGFLIAGAIMAPIVVIHGTGAWFGAW